MGINTMATYRHPTRAHLAFIVLKCELQASLGTWHFDTSQAACVVYLLCPADMPPGCL